MVRAALTGGIATGKSSCLARFAARGASVIDADLLARDVLAPGSPGLDEVARRFGSGVLRADGTVDRAALGRLVFSDHTARADLEAIVHPDVYRRISEWFANQPAGTRLAIADIPLLYETGHEHDFDRVIVCACDPAEQIRRVMARDGLSEAEAHARLAAQWPIAEKEARADYVIHTDSGYAETEQEVSRIYAALIH